MKKILMSLLASALIFSTSFSAVILDKNIKKTVDPLVIAQAEISLLNFVNGVKAAYSGNAANYAQFKTEMIGTSNLTTISSEGEALLQMCYNFIVSNTSDQDIKLQGLNTFINAFEFLNNNAVSNSVSIKANSNSVALFGGDESLLKNSTSSEKRACKWYQIGCHLSNLWDWIVDHISISDIYYGVGIACLIGLIKCKK